MDESGLGGTDNLKKLRIRTATDSIFSGQDWTVSRVAQTKKVSLTRNRFPSKANCDQIQLRHPCGVLMLISNINCFFT